MLFIILIIKMLNNIEHYFIHSHKSYDKSREKMVHFLHIYNFISLRESNFEEADTTLRFHQDFLVFFFSPLNFTQNNFSVHIILSSCIKTNGNIFEKEL